MKKMMMINTACPRKLKKFKHKHEKQMDKVVKYSRIRLWHKGIVYYKYDSSIAKERSHNKTANITAKIKKAIEMFQEQTPVK